VLGHELGHIFQQKMGTPLFSPPRDWTKETWDYPEPQEEEADAISAYLYVPLPFLKEKLFLNTPFEAIAAELEVPYHAVRLRYEIALATGEFLL
jgi:Zn-dependent peptidase ImmA (M78 family)